MRRKGMDRNEKQSNRPKLKYIIEIKYMTLFGTAQVEPKEPAYIAYMPDHDFSTGRRFEYSAPRISSAHWFNSIDEARETIAENDTRLLDLGATASILSFTENELFLAKLEGK